MALALYRKYRPATFAEVVGQEHVTVPLRTALAAKRINHAYLFSGPRGCGKTSSARILARSLNCEQGPTDEPCGTCDSCIGLAPNGPGTVDVIELDAASHGGVDDTRELRDRAFFAPAQSRYRVFIVDEAHMVTTQGFNALLKIVEEPPEHLIFIFATTEPDKVLATIRSRTHHYPFRLIPPGAMRELLERNCAAENATVAPAVFPLVIRAGGGSARDTQSVLDQLLAGAGPEGVTYERAVSLLGVTDVALIDDMVDALAAADSATVYGTVDRLVEAGHDPRRFASDLLDRLRDLVLLRAVPDAAARGLVGAPDDELARMVAQAERLGAATLSRYAEIVHTGLVEMRGATAPRLLLELLCARMLLPSAVSTDAAADSAVLQRLEQLERRLTLAPAAEPASRPEPARQARAVEQPSEPVRSVEGSAPPQAERPRPVITRPSQQAAAQSAPAQSAPAQSTPVQSAPQQAVPAQQAGVQQPVAAPSMAQPVAQPVATAPPVVQQPVAQPAAEQPAAEQPAAEQPSTRQPEAPQPVAQPAADQSWPEPAQLGSETKAVPVEAAAPTSTAPAAPGALDAAGVRRVWSELLGAVRKASRSTEAMLTNATVQSVDGDVVVIAHTAAPLARRLAEPRNTDAIASALTSVLGGRWQVRTVHAEQGGAAPAATRPAEPARTFEPPRRMVPERPAGDDLPPEPPEPDLPPPPEPEDEEEMLAQAASPDQGTDGVRQDPEEAMLKLLADKLGARPVDS